MKKTIKLISILLTMVMTFAFAPFNAFAAESDGVPTTIDVSEVSGFLYIDEDNYDPDGIILTGKNDDLRISIEKPVDITMSNLTARNFFS